MRNRRQRFTNWQRPQIEHGKLTQWNWMVQYPEGLELGEKTDIGAFTYINSKHGVKIGNNVQIGSHCSIYSENTIDGTRGRIEIGQNVCIGAHSTILPNVKIGSNTIVGAYSLVKKDLPANVIATGVPAKVVKQTPARLDKPKLSKT